MDFSLSKLWFTPAPSTGEAGQSELKPTCCFESRLFPTPPTNSHTTPQTQCTVHHPHNPSCDVPFTTYYPYSYSLSKRTFLFFIMQALALLAMSVTKQLSDHSLCQSPQPSSHSLCQSLVFRPLTVSVTTVFRPLTVSATTAIRPLTILVTTVSGHSLCQSLKPSGHSPCQSLQTTGHSPFLTSTDGGGADGRGKHCSITDHRFSHHLAMGQRPGT